MLRFMKADLDPGVTRNKELQSARHRRAIGSLLAVFCVKVNSRTRIVHTNTQTWTRKATPLSSDLTESGLTAHSHGSAAEFSNRESSKQDSR